MRHLAFALALTLSASACDDDGAEPDAGSTDAGSTPMDAGSSDDSGAETDAGPTGSDGGPADFPTPRYDAMGCLTFDSATELCAHDGAVACQRVVGCGLTDSSQCSIDCTMATVLCLDMTRVDACLQAVQSGDCMSVETACDGWMHFP